MTIKYPLLAGLLILSQFAKATSINASSFGFNVTDATSSIVSAMNAGTDTVVVDLQASAWNVSPLNFFNINGKVIIFQPGVKLNAITGAFNNTGACLLKFNSSSNIEIVGYQAVFKMDKDEFILLNNSEYRHSIFLRQCSNITIKGLTLDGSGGDGIYIGSEGSGVNNNILIEDVKCINHYRQGMSISSAQNLTVKNCYFANTEGTLPEAGIDIEPYLPTQSIENVKIENCAFEHNGWVGLAIALGDLDGSSSPVSIEVRDCYFKKNCRPANTYGKCEIYLGADNVNPVQGTVLFERCFIDSSDYSALYTRKTHDAYLAIFKDCVFKDVSQLQIQYNNPIALEVPDYSNPSDYLGGLEFDNVFISYQTNFSFFLVYGWSTLAGIKDITGNFTIVEPNNNPVLYSNVPDTINCNYTFTNQASLPLSTVNFSVIDNTAIECNQQVARYNSERTSSDISYPLAVKYQLSGTATAADDIHFMTGGTVIPANSTVKTDTVFARNDGIQETKETAVLTLANSNLYQIGDSNTAIIDIIDCSNTSISEIFDPTALKAYPNPFSEILTLTGTQEHADIIVTDVFGKTVLQQDAQTGNTEIHIAQLGKGVYFLTYRTGTQHYSVPVIKL